MSKYLIETFYTCTFKIVHKLDELNDKKLSELENRNDGKFEIIDVKLNSRKTKTNNQKNNEIPSSQSNLKNVPNIPSMVNEKMVSKDKLGISNDPDKKNAIEKNPKNFL